MEYRDFRYTDTQGQVDLPSGSRIGAAVSWVILKLLGASLVMVFVGIGASIVKFCVMEQDAAPLMTWPATPTAYAAAVPPPRLIRDVAMAVPMPRAMPAAHPVRRILHRPTHGSARA